MLDQMSREQLVSLLYEILRRLLAPVLQGQSANISGPHVLRQERQLVIDPTIDAWEHSGIYPQGFTAVSTWEGGLPSDSPRSAVPQFGRSGLNVTTVLATPTRGTIIGPLCNSLQQWQLGHRTPQTASIPPAMTGVEPVSCAGSTGSNL